jgi:predicted secreted hydrolase
VYIAHFAVTDADGERFLTAERFSRGALGLAGAQAAPFRVWIDDWEIAESGPSGQWRLRAADPAFSIDIELAPAKPPVLNGDNGLSQKSAEPGNASYYYSITRLATAGSLRLGEDVFHVSGLSWLDREWSTSALGARQRGWDWFALQLSDGSDLMFYNLRKQDGGQDEHSAGTWINADGEAKHLGREDVEIIVNDTWESPEGGAYPSAWTLRVPGQGLEVEVIPVLADQELFTTVRYWEGAVDVQGQRDGAPVTGRGYVELTGYAD